MTTTRACSVSWCHEPHCARGWCRRHYYIWRRYGDPLADTDRAPKGSARAHLAEQLAAEPTDRCMIWPFHVDKDGYGLIYGARAKKGTVSRVHVIACEQINGPRPYRGAQVRHGPCRTPACFNPRHLSWGTGQQNQDDRVRDGTAPVGVGNPRHKLTEAEVLAIRAEPGTPRAELVARYKVSKSLVSQIRARKIWTHI